ncbi:netrin-B-like [Malaya genurostris]|uniref:netrin-B-like n=1 Tax=Malaya genurostris TaxID=325434 RepID=UPI0026F396C2|nr:netrin-B-like [Malaya genurostris]XP_058444027.1 netrin-B-like [Malaya genurostris]XP_058444028.1 netrin-B-like [Malaya genurostris]XP_058444029.1 netrin-B-like [Malaya genurostris]XP_058444030.1 netrin-B-like [Malaya genurostris]XP_058444031.1 netrin-B-like [Malaya genurostris]XP_058444032.1 netrin-B-like [Malaya genurostris]XP_058444033.1 netrin-B-like [Malaya genurostris]XP_058444034.1 netrin-B-like [Malaya genurostris]
MMQFKIRFFLLCVFLSETIGHRAYLRSFQTQTVIDPCYDEDRPRRCMPDFVNAAFGVPIDASSICGKDKPTRYCDYKDQLARNESVCDICDDSDPTKRFSSLSLTDVHNSNNVTCWRSEPRVGSVDPGSQPDNVTLTLSLGKKFELTYVSLMFCPYAIRPDSMAIFKSADYGKTWQPFQFYSSQCRKLYGRPIRATISKTNEQEARCIDHNRYNADGVQGSRIAFSTLEGRPSAQDFDSSPVLQDWVTATDIRVVFHRLQPPTTTTILKTQSSEQIKYKKSEYISKEIFTPPSAGVSTYALSDFAVGGRCKCNGHASKCIKGVDGKLECDCKHNTAGRDCERCKPFYFDRPWGRGTVRDANECKACNCNGHARKCRFNLELYKLSGRVSGGVCSDCRHDTTGRHCHYCREGFYKDPTKAITHKKACKPCDCHPIGSSGKNCNHTSGQCTCKEGVTGLTCNRCARGYQQSRSHIAPCIKIPRVTMVNHQAQNTAPDSYQYDPDASESTKENCGKCRFDTKRLNLNKFCKRDYAIMAKVTGRTSAPSGKQSYASRDEIRFNLQVQTVFKSTSPLLGANSQRKTNVGLLVSSKNLDCRCPSIKINKSYLILGMDSKQSPDSLVLGPKTIIIEWKDDWNRRLRRFQQQSGSCY